MNKQDTRAIVSFLGHYPEEAEVIAQEAISERNRLAKDYNQFVESFRTLKAAAAADEVLGTRWKNSTRCGLRQSSTWRPCCVASSAA